MLILGRRLRAEACGLERCGAPAVLAGAQSEGRETRDSLVRVNFKPAGAERRQDLGKSGSRRHQLIQQDGTPPRLAQKRFVR